MSTATEGAAQIRSLKALAPGWFDGAGTRYDPAALDWLAAPVDRLVHGFELPTPSVYPTPEGHARLEWSAQRWEVIATIDLATKSTAVLAACAESDEIHELPGTVAEPGAEGALGRFLVDHVLAR